MRFNNWNLEMDTFPVRQYDNLTRRLEVSGDIPEGWNWVALLSLGDNLNIVPLQYGEPGLYVDLTAEMIPYEGKYALQLRATQGDKVRHTNIVSLNVNESMSGDAQWPTIPSEFSDAEKRIAEYNQHPPAPGPNGFWMLWDTEKDEYVESQIPLPVGSGGGYRIGDGLKLDVETNTLSVDTVSEVIEDNTQPITSAAVFTTVGNIEVILKTI